jgi:small conductance mechanosensitive channel
VPFSEALARALSGGLSSELKRAEVWLPWAIRGIHVLVIVAGAMLLTRLAHRALNELRGYIMQSMARHGETPDTEMEKRAATIVAVLKKLTGTLVWMVALVMALTELTFHIEPLLAGLGVAGLAVGLGAQTLIKDWLGGVFLLLEDQLRIGDAVTANLAAGGPYSGAVEEINLRTTVLRAENGAVHVIPNGQITALSNFTREYSYYIFETTLAHHADAQRALALLAEAAAAIVTDPEFAPMIRAPLEVMGVDKLTERGAVIRARIKTVPSKQNNVGRELNLRVKTAFDAAGIAFPPPG